MPTVKANDGPGSEVDADTLDGMDSSSYLPGGNLPSGTTIRGSYAEADYAEFAGQAQYAAISFGYSIPNLTPHYIAPGQPTPQGCTGNANNPGAQPGHLCFFEAFSQNLLPDRNTPFSVGPGGAVVGIQAANVGTYYAGGSWAATAP
jgi:hypothetical protein